ncbi:MAG: tetratricopeptide repeat protein [Parachlamydiales bacterium]|nr:tetratricopeptide repeat protein [Parachlamydiales bacterium]
MDRSMRLFWILATALPLVLRAESEEEALFLRRIADFWQEGEYQIAKTQMEEFIVDYPQSPFADALCAALGDLFLREKNFSGALNYYSQVQSPEFIQKVFLNRMQCLYEMQWYATLADECEAYLETTPNLHVTYFLAIALYHQCINASKDTDQLLKLAERAKPYFETLYQSELAQEVAQGYAHLSCILKDYSKATEIYTDLAEKNPAMEEEMLFQVALIQSEYDKVLALGTFEKISKLGRKRAKEAAYNRMVLAFDLGRYEDIVTGDLISQIPADRAGIARLFLGRSLLQTKHYAEAAKELKAYIQTAPVSETLFAALLSLLDASYQTGDLQSLDEAIGKLALHYPQNPELPKAYFSRAQILKRNERYDEAKAELDKLIAEYPAFPQKAQVMFELTHLDFKAKNWDGCYKRGLAFLNAFAGHELSPFVWRYFVSSSSEIAMQKAEHKPQLLADLEVFLRLPLTEVEKNEWQLLQAKTHFELKQYEAAMQSLKSQDTPNAQLLLSLCYRDGYRNIEQFCKTAEEALQKGANLVDSGQIHASLYNAYLELSNMDKAAQHLYDAFMAKAELKSENILWLADHYYNQLLDEEGNFVIAARAAALYLKAKSFGAEQATCRLAKVYSILGRIDDAIALLENLSNPSQEAQLILAENYAKKGIVDQAAQIFDAIVTSCGTGRSPVAAAAALHGSRLKMAQGKPNLVEIATQLKNLVLQKNFEGEPLYLEAALDYVALAAKNDPAKKAALLQKTKEDFEQRNDLLSKDYHAAREKSPRKNITYQGYMKLIDAEIALSEAKIDRVHQKDLQAKSKTLLLQIMETPIASCLKERVQKLLADET